MKLTQDETKDWMKVQQLIKVDAKCPNCSRKMSQWYGCESPDCPVPTDIAAKHFAGF